MGPPNGPHMGSGNARRKKAGHWQRRASLVQTETAFARAFRGLRCQKRPPEGKGELAEPPEKTGSREERQAGAGGKSQPESTACSWGGAPQTTKRQVPRERVRPPLMSLSPWQASEPTFLPSALLAQPFPAVRPNPRTQGPQVSTGWE